MTRNLKALGLAFAAMLALGAVAASAASAQNQGELTSDGPVTLTGTETGELFDNSFTSDPGDVTCAGSEYTGHEVLTHEETTVAEEEHETIGNNMLPASGSTTATITPHYVNCITHAFFGFFKFPTTVTMNGCDYVFHIGETTEHAGKNAYGIEADLVCPAGKDVEIHVYEEGAPEHTPERHVCTVTIEPQNSLSGPHLLNTEGDDIGLTGAFTGIHETHEGSACGTGEGEAELDVDITIEGHNAEGEPTPVTISDEA